MLETNLQLQLEAMPNKTFVYGGQFHFIKDVVIDEEEEKVTLITSLNTYPRKFGSIGEFLKYWKRAPEKEDQEEKAVPHKSLQVVQPKVEAVSPKVPATRQTPEAENAMLILLEKETSLADKMIAVLEDNIKKVQENKDYIPQAQAINNNVNSIINVSKMKLNFVNSLRKR